MKTTRKIPAIIMTTALLAAVLGGCKKEDNGIGGDGDAAAVSSRTEGAGNSGAAGTVGASGNAGDTGLGGVEYNTNNNPRTVGENEGGSRENTPGAVGGASGVSGAVEVGPNGSTTGGANPGGAPMAPAPAAGSDGSGTTGSTGNSTGTGPASTRAGAGESGR
ncbi:hypothetical protein QPK31_19530 [Massilia sp. YIM B02769]|uniref:hypothetical protein n=1 Tax=Massilia sp. YIM B02769 TaxID=3050129 RepID=UPI0025B676EF|nr:hypothetical protein [Massilia sp. YIM B02769]MDN4060405.1 hypothetical protein [Massilia sp. YIM B02769]